MRVYINASDSFLRGALVVIGTLPSGKEGETTLYVDSAVLGLSVPVFKRQIAMQLLGMVESIEEEEDDMGAESHLTFVAREEGGIAVAHALLALMSKCGYGTSMSIGDDSFKDLIPAGSELKTLSCVKFALSTETEALVERVVASILRDRERDERREIRRDEEDRVTGGPAYCKPFPDSETGLTVLELFSGIGGFRLSLPPLGIQGVAVKHIVAIDCSDTVCDIYDHNFHRSESAVAGTVTRSVLRRCLIARGSVIVESVDGLSDVWTLSPPCQPYTTTRGALSRDERDNRSKGLDHLTHLLRHMKLRPRYIILENVAGFVGSNMLAKWKVTLGDCGYTWREFLLSPTDVGVPNERRRYYMVCESSLSAPPGSSPPEDGRLVRFIPSQENEIRTSLPALPGSNVMLKTIGDFLLVEKGSEESERLLVPQRLLSAAWAPSRLSICGKNDTRSYCFTKGYGRIFDRSSGSLLFTLGDTGSQLDRTTLSEQHGHLRLFSPEELLLLFGFPPTYTFPDGLSQSQKYAAVGNSISIPVLSAFIASVFSSASPA